VRDHQRTADGKVLYRNAFATSLAVNDANVAEVIASGRARWKIENENNNTLKTKGYRFEHKLRSWPTVLVFFTGDAHLARLLVAYAVRFNGRQVLPASSKTNLRANVCSMI